MRDFDEDRASSVFYVTLFGNTWEVDHNRLRSPNHCRAIICLPSPHVSISSWQNCGDFKDEPRTFFFFIWNTYNYMKFWNFLWNSRCLNESLPKYTKEESSSVNAKNNATDERLTRTSEWNSGRVRKMQGWAVRQCGGTHRNFYAIFSRAIPISRPAVNIIV